MLRTTIERLKRIQTELNVEPDGKLGPQTLAAIEAKVFEKKKAPEPTNQASIKSKTGLTLTKTGVEFIISHEISSRSYYEARLTKPTWPGGDSGVTIGIGYDLGYCTADEFEASWGPLLNAADVIKLKNACGEKGHRAQRMINGLSSVKVPYSAAQEVFTNISVPSYAKKACKAFPGIEELEPDAQTAILSIVYNRGTSMKGDRRKEMLDIKNLISSKNYASISQKIRDMKRLWLNRGLDGLLKRRDEEADMVEHCVREYKPDELISV